MTNYGLMDAKSCVHHKSGTLILVLSIQDLPSEDLDIDDDVHDVCGIPQRTANSGNCFVRGDMSCAILLQRAENVYSIENFRRVAQQPSDTCLESPHASEELRARLWYDFQFGDKIGQHPELDGQNGLSQFCGFQIENPRAPILSRRRQLCRID